MCHEALIRCLGRLRAAIVAYAELLGTLEPGPEREEILGFCEVLARQARVVDELCRRRCGTSRCAAAGNAGG